MSIWLVLSMSPGSTKNCLMYINDFMKSYTHQWLTQIKLSLNFQNLLIGCIKHNILPIQYLLPGKIRKDAHSANSNPLSDRGPAPATDWDWSDPLPLRRRRGGWGARAAHPHRLSPRGRQVYTAPACRPEACAHVGHD